MGIFDKIFKRKASTGQETVVETKKPAAKPAKKATKPAAKPAAKTADKQPQCAALTAAGKQCARSARSGSKYCASHKGYQPPARGKARAGTNTKPAVDGAKDTAAAGRRPVGVKQCAAKTKAGSQCKRDARKGSKYCGNHKGYRA